jgi:acyl-CoA thioester hydrolase
VEDMVDSKEKPSGLWLKGKVRFPVYYEDTDFSGYVYHANYLKYFERAREELVGMPYLKELFHRGLHYVVARIEVAYHFPAKHADIVEIETQMEIAETPICMVKQTAFRVPESENGERIRLVTGKVKLVAVDSKGDIARIPEDVAAYFLKRVNEQSI